MVISSAAQRGRGVAASPVRRVALYTVLLAPSPSVSPNCSASMDSTGTTASCSCAMKQGLPANASHASCGICSSHRGTAAMRFSDSRSSCSCRHERMQSGTASN